MNSSIPVARIESRPYPKRHARGWFCLGLSRQYGEEPRPLKVFGTQLVAFRGPDLKINVLDGFCPHMGADLSKGTIVNGNLSCPFHDWQWGADGFCKHIPYASSIPARARIKCWPTLEKNGLLYVWHDPENNAPIAAQEIPEMPEYYSDEWSDWQIREIRIHNNARELIDNMADMGHFGPVHGAPALHFRNIVHGHTFTQIMEGDPAGLENSDSLHSEATYFGPAVMTTKMVSMKDGVPLESRLLVANVPIDHDSFDLRFGIMVKRIPLLSRDLNDYIVQKYIDSTTQGFLQDVEIWHNKVRVDNPVLCDGDGPVHKLRKWYEQFYMDIGEVPAEFAERREYVTR